MTGFSDISQTAQLIINQLLLFSALSLLALGLYRFVLRGKILPCVKDAVLLLAELLIISALVTEVYNGKTPFGAEIPFILPLFFALAVFAYSAFGFVKERKAHKDMLSPTSVKEALDNLKSGVCFSDSEGRIILINHAMSELYEFLTGSYPQRLFELSEAIEGTERLSEDLYRLPDLRVIRIKKTALAQPGLEGVTQLSVFDVTELFGVNEKLSEENEELRKTNEELKKMYERIADRIREEETLNLRIKIHDEIGTSLIAINELIKNDSSQNIDESLSELQNAVSFLTGVNETQAETLESVKHKAEKMKVRLVTSGTPPEDSEQYRLCVLAAGECLTNCVKHACADTLFIDFKNIDGLITVRYTNNGDVPRAPINEGGGLSSLRRSVEKSGGIMKVEAAPEFSLELILKKGGMKND